MQKYIAVIKRYIAAICREIWLSFLKIITVMLSLVQDVFLSNDKPDLYLAVQCTCTVYTYAQQGQQYGAERAGVLARDERLRRHPLHTRRSERVLMKELLFGIYVFSSSKYNCYWNEVLQLMCKGTYIQ